MLLWIVVGILISKILNADNDATPFYIAGIAGISLGFYSFSLPKTPPLLSKDAPISFRDIIGLNALNKLKSKSFFVFALSSFLICIPLAAYYNFAPIFVSDMGMITKKYKDVLLKECILFEENKHTNELIINADLVIKSPGIPENAPLIVQLKEKKCFISLIF